MIDFIELFVLIYGVIWYHGIIIMMNYLIVNMECGHYEWFRKICIFYPTIAGIIHMSGIFHTTLLWFELQVFYSTGLLLIWNIGNSKYYFLLGLSSMMFISEFYEIPIYIWRFIMHGEFVMNNIQSFFSVFAIVSKLSCILYMMYYMHVLNINYKKFIMMLLRFSPVFILDYIIRINLCDVFIVFRMMKFFWFVMILMFIYRNSDILSVSVKR